MNNKNSHHYTIWADDFIEYNKICNAFNYSDLTEVKIAILDTGCSEHDFLCNFNIVKYNVLQNTETVDIYGHGTMCIGVLANYCTLEGKIPCQIISIKISENGRVKLEDIISGIELGISLNVDVINVGMCNYYYNEDLAGVIHKATSKGIIVVSPIANYIKDIITFPGALDTVICCGSVNKYGEVAKHSNVNNLLNILAPGEEILGPLGRDCQLTNHFKDESFTALSGTSFASIMVTAFAAIMKSINHKIDYLEILQMFENHCEKISVNTLNQVICVPVLNFYHLLSTLSDGSYPVIKREEHRYWKISFSECNDYCYRIKGSLYDAFGQRESNLNEIGVTKVFTYSNFDKSMHISQEKAVTIINGEFQTILDKLNYGENMIEVCCKNVVPAVNSIIVKLPIPDITFFNDDSVSVFKVNNSYGYKVLYSYDDKPITIMGDTLGQWTKIYENEFVISGNDKRKINYANYYDGVFSEVKTINLN